MQPPSIKNLSFKFPLSQKPFHQLPTIEDIKTQLQLSQNLFNKYKVNNLYQILSIHSKNTSQLIATCKQCPNKPSKLLWQKPQTTPSYHLKKFNPTHNHKITFNQLIQQISNLLSKLSNQQPLQRIKQHSIKYYSISQQQFYYIYHQFNNQLLFRNFYQNLQILSNTHIIKTIPQIPTIATNPAKYPTFLSLTSKPMLTNLHHYGRVLYLHRFAYLIKKPPQDQNDYYLLTITGLNSFANIIFYALSITTEITPTTICQTLIHLFSYTTSTLTQSIFSQNEPQFIQGIQLFLQKTHRKITPLWDMLIEIKQQDPTKKQQLKKCLSAPTPQQFKSAIENFKTLKPKQTLKIQAFRKKAPKYTLSQSPPTFIGLQPPLTHCSDILHAIIQQFPQQLQYHQFLFPFADFANNNTIYRYPDKILIHTEIALLNDCIGVIAEEPYQRILNNLINTMGISVVGMLEDNKLQIERKSAQVHIVELKHKTNPFLTNTFTTYTDIQLSCPCNIKIKTGLPCSHIIRACLHLGIPISSQIDTFWKLQSSLQKQQLNETTNEINIINQHKYSYPFNNSPLQ